MTDERIDSSVYFCFILNSFGELSEAVISEIVLCAAPSQYFEIMSSIEFMLRKGLIAEMNASSEGAPVYGLLDEGKRIAEDMSSSLDRLLRERTLNTGREIISKNDRERSVKCDIIRYSGRDRCDLHIKFLNELNGETLLDLTLYAPDESKAREMRERFLAKPSIIISRIMNMFIKDDLFMYDHLEDKL